MFENSAITHKSKLKFSLTFALSKFSLTFALSLSNVAWNSWARISSICLALEAVVGR